MFGLLWNLSSLLSAVKKWLIKAWWSTSYIHLNKHPVLLRTILYACLIEYNRNSCLPMELLLHTKITLHLLYIMFPTMIYCWSHWQNACFPCQKSNQSWLSWQSSQTTMAYILWPGHCNHSPTLVILITASAEAPLMYLSSHGLVWPFSSTMLGHQGGNVIN